MYLLSKKTNMTAKVLTSFEKRQERSGRKEAMLQLAEKFDVVQLEKDPAESAELVKLFFDHIAENGDSVAVFKKESTQEANQEPPRTFLMAKEDTAINAETLQSMSEGLRVAIVADTHNCTVPVEALKAAMHKNQELWLVNIREHAPAEQAMSQVG